MVFVLLARARLGMILTITCVLIIVTMYICTYCMLSLCYCRTTIRCYMLLALNAGMALSPPVPFLNRAQLFGSNAQQHSQPAQAWQGQRSGRIFRSVHSGRLVCIVAV